MDSIRCQLIPAKSFCNVMEMEMEIEMGMVIEMEMVMVMAVAMSMMKIKLKEIYHVSKRMLKLSKDKWSAVDVNDRFFTKTNPSHLCTLHQIQDGTDPSWYWRWRWKC